VTHDQVELREEGLGPVPRAPADGVAPSPMKNPQFVNLMAISITVALGFGMLIPVLPEYAESFGVSLAVAGLVQFVFGFTRFSFGVVGGLVVDRFGERACTMAGLLIVALSSYAVGFSQNFPQLVLARGFGGAGSALFIGGLMNRILRIVSPEAMGRATGIFRSSFLVGIAFGPALGGLVNKHFGLKAPFHFYATGLLIATAIAFLVMRDDPANARPIERRKPLDALRAARPLLGDSRYVIALLATFVGWWTISGPAQWVGTIFAKNELGLSDEQRGYAITMLAIGEMIVLLVAGRASDRYGRRAVLLPSLGVAAVATALLGQVHAAWAFYPVMMAIGAGVAASATAAGGLLADAIPRGGSGAAVGVNQMAGDLGYLIAPTIVGGLAESSSFELAYLVGALPAALVFGAALKTRQRTSAPST
jgi:DHA1 family multidrug resistance protein-like MFS transporter